ncbi:MAG: hypothetical protein ACQESC_01690 [Nanobdellota archaeon]
MFPEDAENEEIYSDGGREDLIDNDEVDADEEAFMTGYDQERNKTAHDESSEDADDEYEKVFEKKKKRRSKRKSSSFDEEDLEADVTLK